MLFLIKLIHLFNCNNTISRRKLREEDEKLYFERNN